MSIDSPGRPDTLFASRDIEAQLVRDSVRARLFGADAEGGEPGDSRSSGPPRIGRFTVLHTLGAGGMGVVFAAYDDELDRKVAIKLLRGRDPEGQSRGQARLLREAQGLARLAHPNVVGVHEVGEYEGSVFVAMEFVAGDTLRDWLAKDEKREPAEILEVLVQAGRGLVAAHEAGLVHRDFKPDNLMVGSDGRVRVLDFGLAHAESERSPTRPSGVEGDTEELDALTLAGSIVGTPMYMAPEQHRGGKATPAWDQFAFCLTAWRALYGYLPFGEPESLESLVEAVSAGELIPPPRDSAVPRRVRAALTRGLSPDPEARWPSMVALVDELEAAIGPPARRGWALAGAALIGGLLTLGLALAVDEDAAAPSCELSEGLLVGTWDADRGRAVHEAFAATKLDYAGQAEAIVRASLDDWSARWLEVQREGCEATHVHKLRSPAELDRRSACLADQRVAVAGLVGVLEEADAELLEHLDAMLATLPEPGECARPDAIGRVQDPSDEALVEQLGRAEALMRAGKLDEAEAVAHDLKSAALEPDDVLELERRALLASVAFHRGRHRESIAAMRELAAEAARAERLPLEAKLRLRAAALAADVLGDVDLERWLVDDADLALDRAKVEGWRPRFYLDRARAHVIRHEGRIAEARDAFRALVDAAEDRGLSREATRARVDLANAEASLGNYAAAEALYVEARAEQVERWGPVHPSVANLQFMVGLLELDRGEIELAEQAFAEAVEIYERLEGPSSWRAVNVRAAQGKAAMLRGDFKAAAEILDAVYARHVEVLGRDHEDSARILVGVASARFYEGELEQARRGYEEVLRIVSRELGDGHEDVALAHSNLGDALLALGRPAEANAHYGRAIAIFRRALPEDHPLPAFAYAGRGEAALALGDASAALPDLERALSLHEQHEAQPIELAETRFALARALGMLGEDSERARAQVDLAIRTFAELGMDAEQAAAEAWRAQR